MIRIMTRINLILISIFLIAAAIIGRLVFIQILEHDFYSALAQGQQKFFAQIQGERGEIFFRDGEPLAINRNYVFVFASPAEIENPEETAVSLSEILDLDKDFVLERIIRENSFFELIKNKLTRDEIADLKKIDRPGI